MKISLQRDFYYEITRMSEVINNPVLLIMDCGRVAFLTHLRNLWEFFYGNIKKNNNQRIAHAGNFRQIKKWKKRKASEDMGDKNIGKWYDKLCVYLSHLSYRRVEEEHNFPISMDLYQHFRNLIVDFLEDLPKKYKTDELEGLKEGLKNSTINDYRSITFNVWEKKR